MSRRYGLGRRADAGFTLIEMLLAIALLGLLVGALGAVTAQWLPNWNRGLLRVQRNEQLNVALDRLAADVSAAEYVSAIPGGRTPYFTGEETAVTFVRSAVGPNTKPGLEFVRIAEVADARGPLLVRTRARFAPLIDPSVAIPFSDPVVLVRAPQRIAFSYLGLDGVWSSVWRNSSDLPRAVRFAGTNVDPFVAGAASIHVELMAPQVEPQANDQHSQENQTSRSERR